MRKVIAFRVTAHQQEVLDMAEQIYQKPASTILAQWVENELPYLLKMAISKGRRPMPFTPPIQRTRKKKNASDPS
jgi:hypothetical protein